MVEDMSPKFWLLQRDGSPERQKVKILDSKSSDPVICPAQRAHRRPGKRIGTLSVIGTPSAMKKDFVSVWGSELLISRRVLEIFDRYRVTGFEVRPVSASYYRDKHGRPPDLFELVVVGWGGVAAPAAGASLDYWCPDCGRKHYAIAEPSQLIDPAGWDGSDIFMVWPLPAYRFVSNRLADILRQERVSGVETIPASEIPLARGCRVGPGSLSNFMPEARARELEDRFGVSQWLLPRGWLGRVLWLARGRQ